jgi:UDP-glucose 4-epimerase
VTGAARAADPEAGGLSWVVGQGGLLGSHLARRLAAAAGGALWSPPAPGFAWSSPVQLRAQMDRAAGAFFDAVAAGGHRRWAVYWAAGASIVGTTTAALAGESEILAHALGRIVAHRERVVAQGQKLGRPVARAGLVFLASSAGGVYGRCPDSPATEASPCLPVSDYGREKLRQEAQLIGWARAHGVGHLIGRISNLYGPGQNLAKPQGLITHLVRSLVLDQPVHLYVSLDTLRDYIHVDDCARDIVAATTLQASADPASGAIKIFASEEATSISALIGIISRVTRRRPRVVYAAPRALTELQPRRLTFRSAVMPLPRGEHIGLPVGVSQVHRHLLALFRDGKLAPAPPAPG